MTTPMLPGKDRRWIEGSCVPGVIFIGGWQSVSGQDGVMAGYFVTGEALCWGRGRRDGV